MRIDLENVKVRIQALTGQGDSRIVMSLIPSSMMQTAPLNISVSPDDADIPVSRRADVLRALSAGRRVFIHTSGLKQAGEIFNVVASDSVMPGRDVAR